MRENKSNLSGALSLAALIAAAIAVIVLSPSCGNNIDREFGPRAIQGVGQLPGRSIITSAPTGL